MNQARKNQKMLKDEIELAIQEIGHTEVGSEERSRAVQDLCALKETYTESVKAQNEVFANYIGRVLDLLKIGVTVGLSIVDLVVIGGIIEYENTGTVTSFVGKTMMRGIDWVKGKVSIWRN